VIDPNIPEDAIAIRQGDWDDAVRAAGLMPVGEVMWGSWCGRENFTSFQDMALLRKPA
jgi:cellobiose phosphorylase